MTQRHNVVFILTDDQGMWALGCAGNSEIQTPNLDRLAATGIRFSNFFCTSPVCSPARASILTGRIPSQHGVHDWIRSGNLDHSALSTELREMPHFQSETRPIEYLAGQFAYTDALAAHGYVCGLSGKWHLGDSLRPQKGFSHWFTIARGGCNYSKPDLIRNGQVVIENSYVTDLITDNALEFLATSAKSDNPFYLSIHYTAPHSSWDRDQHPVDLFALYDNCPCLSVPTGLQLHPDQISTCPQPEGDEERRRELVRGYYAATSGLDRGVGQVLDFLEANGLRENTLVIFTSDNGMNLGHHGIWGKGNGTFPQNMFDTSVKVPAIMSHCGNMPQGKVCDDLLSHYDLMPTLLDYLGLPSAPEQDKLPGTSFAPILRGDSMSTRDCVAVYDEYGPVRMIRTQEWKYVHRYPYGAHELYDLVADPDEQNNLADCPDFTNTLLDMRRRMTDWFNRYADPAVDGTREAVTGFGQLNLAGAAGQSADTYFVNKNLNAK